MEFGWISVFGAGIVILMAIPSVLYAVRYKEKKSPGTDRLMALIEQTGRYACIVLMWLPLLIREFGFSSLPEAFLYMIGNGCLLAAYGIVFACHLKRKTAKRALALTVLSACVFLLSGLLLHHWLLAASALLFAAGHLCMVKKRTDASAA